MHSVKTEVDIEKEEDINVHPSGVRCHMERDGDNNHACDGQNGRLPSGRCRAKKRGRRAPENIQAPPLLSGRAVGRGPSGGRAAVGPGRGRASGRPVERSRTASRTRQDREVHEK
jgi:hypothetical protein